MRFNYDDAEHYGGSGNGGSYFKLSKDGEIAKFSQISCGFKPQTAIVS